MNEIELQHAAREYARQVMFTAEFNIKEGLSPAAADRYYTPIHDQLVAAFIAGYRAHTDPKAAA